MLDPDETDPYGPNREEEEFAKLAKPIEFEENKGTEIRGYLRQPDQPGPVRGQVRLPTEAMDAVAVDAFKGRHWRYKGPLYHRDGGVTEYKGEVEISGYHFLHDGVHATIFVRHSVV